MDAILKSWKFAPLYGTISTFDLTVWEQDRRSCDVWTTIDEFNTQCTKLVKSSDYPAKNTVTKECYVYPHPGDVGLLF